MVIDDGTLTYVSRGLREANYIGDSYRKWRTNILAEINKGTYKSRMDVLINNKMPLIELKVPMDEFESKSESDPSEW